MIEYVFCCGSDGVGFRWVLLLFIIIFISFREVLVMLRVKVGCVMFIKCGLIWVWIWEMVKGFVLLEYLEVWDCCVGGLGFWFWWNEVNWVIWWCRILSLCFNWWNCVMGLLFWLMLVGVGIWCSWFFRFFCGWVIWYCRFWVW